MSTMKILLNGGILLAIYISTGSVLVFAHGFFGTGSAFTIAILVASTISLLLTGRRAFKRANICDVLYCLLLLCVAISFIKNGNTSNTKEIALLLVTLAAYPAGRVVPGDADLKPMIGTTAVIVAIGAVVSAVALVKWGDIGKPLVFGEFASAPTQFTISLTVLLIAVACTKLTYRSTFIACCLVAVPVAIFAASVVRFALIAMVASLVLACFLDRSREQRLRVGALIGTIVISIAFGFVARANVTMQYLQYAISIVPGIDKQASPVTLPAQPAAVSGAPVSAVGTNTAKARDCPDTPTPDSSEFVYFMRNSVAIREQLYIDAFRLLPHAGFFGTGLDSFMASSCVDGHEVHNTLLQVAIEFGWLPGLILAALIAIGLMSLVRMSRGDLEARFVLCSLFFLTCIAMAYGQISRDTLLFLFIGYTSGIRRPLLNLG
jgi:hypothetical protein